jgi:Cu/Ag efflux protein CusF
MVGGPILVWILLGLALSASAGDAPRFEVDGRVLAVDEANRHLAVAHGPIPGLMPAMNMRFVVADLALLSSLRRGHLIRFVLELRNDEWTITAVQVVTPAARRACGIPVEETSSATAG